MRRIQQLFPLLFILIPLFFFYPIIKGDIPFPGDLLVGHHEPYKSQAYGGYAPGGVPHKAQGPDVITQLFPWKFFVIDSYKNGNIPFWNPYQFSGTPQLADFQSGAFSPLNIIFLFTDFVTGWTIFIFLTPVISFLFLYLYLKEIGLTKTASLFGGIVFSFSSYMVVWMEYGNIGQTLMWLPFLLFCTEKMVKKYEKKWAVIFILSGVCAFLAGYIQGYFYLTGFIAVYYFVKKYLLHKLELKSSILFTFILIAPILLTLFQLLPTLQLFSYSSRGNYTLDQIQNLLNPFWYAITVLAPDFFGHPASRNQWVQITYIERVSYFGFIPFLLSLYALLSTFKKHETKIFGIVFIATFLLTLDVFFTKFLYLIPIPVISTTVPTRLLSLFVFSGAILSAIGFDLFVKKEQYKKLFISTGIVFGVLVFLWLVVLTASPFFKDQSITDGLIIAKRNLILPTFYGGAFIGILSLFIFVKKKFVKSLVVLGIFCVVLFDLFFFFHKITPFSPREYVYPQTAVLESLKKQDKHARYWGYGTAGHSSNFATVENIYSVEGVDALHLFEYTELLESTKDGTVPENVSRSDANLTPGFGPGNLEENKYRKKMMNMLGVKYILHKNDGLTQPMSMDSATFPGNQYKLIWQESPWQIYENIDVVDRAFITSSYSVVQKDDFFSAFYNNFNEKTEVLLFEDPEIQKSASTTGSVKFVEYSHNNVKIKATSSSDAMLVLSDTYYPEWKAKINGKDAKIYNANYSMRAVKIQEGENNVEFYYSPKLFHYGLVASVIFSILLFIFFKKMKVAKL